MDSALPMLLFFGFLFGTTLLVLICGYQSREQERAEEKAEADRKAASQWAPNGFFGPLPSVDRAWGETGGDGLLAGLQEYVQRERSVASTFVMDPSIETLFVRSPRAVDVLAQELEAHLTRERGVVSEFVADPCVNRLFPALKHPQGTAQEAAGWPWGSEDGRSSLS